MIKNTVNTSNIQGDFWITEKMDAQYFDQYELVLSIWWFIPQNFLIYGKELVFDTGDSTHRIWFFFMLIES